MGTHQCTIITRIDITILIRRISIHVWFKLGWKGLQPFRLQVKVNVHTVLGAHTNRCTFLYTVVYIVVLKRYINYNTEQNDT